MADPSAAFASRMLVLEKYGRTGVLEVEAETITTFVYFLQGVPVFAEEGAVGVSLGRVLVAAGLLSDDDCARVAERLRAEPATKRFGEVAVALGLLTAEALDDALAEQVLQRVLGCFGWIAPECRFHAAPEALDEVPHYPLDIEPTLLEGVKTRYDPERTEAVLGPLRHRYARLASSAADVAARFGMKPTEAAFIGSIRGRRTVDQVVTGATLDSLHAEQVLTALVLADEIVLEDTSVATSREIRAENAVTVKIGGDAPVVRVGPRPRLPRRSKPAVVRPPGQSQRPSMPPPPDTRREQLEAESAFQHGKRALAEGATQQALTRLRRAAFLRPDAVEYALSAEWAELLVARDDTAAAASRRLLEELVDRAVRENPKLSFAHFVKGHLRMHAGDDVGALKCFRFAHRLDPRDRESERYVRILSARVGR